MPKAEPISQQPHRDLASFRASPVHDDGRGIVADGCRVQCPLTAGQLTGLHRVEADGGEPITARLPGQKNTAGTHVLLPHQRLAGGLRAIWGRQGAESIVGTAPACRAAGWTPSYLSFPWSPPGLQLPLPSPCGSVPRCGRGRWPRAAGRWPCTAVCWGPAPR